MFFIDSSIAKNRNAYRREFIEIATKNPQLQVHLFYNGEFFEALGDASKWTDLKEALSEWRSGIPDSFELNFDSDIEQTLKMTALFKISDWSKLIASNVLWDGDVIQAVFPTGSVFLYLLSLFETQLTTALIKRDRDALQKLTINLRQRLKDFYGLEV